VFRPKGGGIAQWPPPKYATDGQIFAMVVFREGRRPGDKCLETQAYKPTNDAARNIPK